MNLGWNLFLMKVEWLNCKQHILMYMYMSYSFSMYGTIFGFWDTLFTCSRVLDCFNGVAFLCLSLGVYFLVMLTGDVGRCLDEGTSGESRQLKRRVCAKSNEGNPTQTNEHYSLSCPYQSSLSNGKFL